MRSRQVRPHSAGYDRKVQRHHDNHCHPTYQSSQNDRRRRRRRRRLRIPTQQSSALWGSSRASGSFDSFCQALRCPLPIFVTPLLHHFRFPLLHPLHPSPHVHPLPVLRLQCRVVWFRHNHSAGSSHPDCSAPCRQTVGLLPFVPATIQSSPFLSRLGRHCRAALPQLEAAPFLRGGCAGRLPRWGGWGERYQE